MTSLNLLVYVRPPRSSNDILISTISCDVSSYLKFDRGNTAIFESTEGVQLGSRVKITDEFNQTRFIGVVVDIEFRDLPIRSYTAISTESLLKSRYTPRFSYPGNVGVMLSDVLSSDPPIQSPGNNQYTMGLLWLSRSLIPSGVVSWDISTGIGTIPFSPVSTYADVPYHISTESDEYLLTESSDYLIIEEDISTGTASIYLDGILLSLQSDGDLSGNTYCYCINGSNILVKGAGAGDIYGAVCISDLWENWIRLGDVDDAELTGEFAPDIEPISDLVRDICGEHAKHLYTRMAGDYIYIDIVDDAPGRGSASSPWVNLIESQDFSSYEMSSTNDTPISALIGIGAGGTSPEGLRYVAGTPTSSMKPWIEDTYTITDARNSPWGNLSQSIEGIFDARNQPPPITLDLLWYGPTLGDWARIQLETGAVVTAQLQEIQFGQGSLPKATFGSDALDIKTAFIDHQETAAIESYRDKIAGSESSSPTELTCRWICQWFANTGMIYDSGAIIIATNSYRSFLYYDATTLEYIDWTMLSISDWIFDLCMFNDDYQVLTGEDWQYDAGSCVVMGDYMYAIQNNYLKKYNTSLEMVDSFDLDLGLDDEYCMPLGICTDGTYLYVSEWHLYDNGKEWDDVMRLSKFNSDIDARLATTDVTQAGAVEYLSGYIYLTSWWPDYFSTGVIKKYNTSFVLQSSASFNCPHGLTTDGTSLFGVTEDYDTATEAYLLRKFDGDFNLDEAYGEVYLEDPLENDPWTMNFTPDDFNGDPGLILFSLSCSDDDAPTHPDATVTYFVLVNTSVFYILYNQPWVDGFNDLDITKGCKLDGTEETIRVYVRWCYRLEETLEFTGTVRGTKKQ